MLSDPQYTAPRGHVFGWNRAQTLYDREARDKAKTPEKKKSPEQIFHVAPFGDKCLPNAAESRWLCFSLEEWAEHHAKQSAKA